VFPDATVQTTAAGAGGSSLEAVASGALSDGSTVVVNSDGTVSVVAGAAQSAGTPVVFESADTTDTSTTYDSTNQKIVIAYKDFTNSQYGTAVVGTVSGASISFGTPVVFESASSEAFSATYDSTNNKIVIAYQDTGNSGYGTAIVGTVSGTSISFGSAAVFESALTTIISTTFDSTNDRVVIAYRDGGNSDYGTARVGTVSGTSISFGTVVVFESASTSSISATYDSTNNKVVIAYTDEGNSLYGTAIVGTVSGTSISFGSSAVFTSSNTTATSTIFDSANNQIVIAYRDNDNSGYGTVITGAVSGTSISFGAATVFESASSINIYGAYDTLNQKTVINYTDAGNSSYGTSVIFQPASTNLTAENFIGISDGAYADTATATVLIAGSVSEAQAGLTAGQSYYVQTDGTLSTTPDDPSVFAGTAIAATKLIVQG
jgi:hypothetical protein